MDFGFTEDQRVIRDLLNDFFEKECPMESVRDLKQDENGFDLETWHKMAELGYMGLTIPDDYGGTGGDFLELVIIMEEMGRYGIPSPYFTTVGLCASAIEAFGTEVQKQEALPKIATEGEIWSLALHEEAADYEAADIKLSAVVKNDGYVLNGSKRFVAFAAAARKLLVAARTDNGGAPEAGVTLFLVDTGSRELSVTEIPTSAPGKRYELQFDNVHVGADAVLGEIHGGWAVIDHMINCGAVLKAAEMSGGAQAALNLAVSYAKKRVQFGQPIATYQSIQHTLVKMLTESDSLRNQVYEAAWNISMGTPSRLLNSAAKVKANQAYHRICFDAILTHGAIGWTAEMDISMYLLRAKDLENDCGGSDFHREWIARELENQIPAFLT